MRQDGQREAWWWLYHKCWGEGPQHISWYSGVFFCKYGVSEQAEGPWPAWVSLCGAETDL